MDSHRFSLAHFSVKNLENIWWPCLMTAGKDDSKKRANRQAQSAVHSPCTEIFHGCLMPAWIKSPFDCLMSLKELVSVSPDGILTVSFDALGGILSVPKSFGIGRGIGWWSGQTPWNWCFFFYSIQMTHLELLSLSDERFLHWKGALDLDLSWFWWRKDKRTISVASC